MRIAHYYTFTTLLSHTKYFYVRGNKHPWILEFMNLSCYENFSVTDFQFTSDTTKQRNLLCPLNPSWKDIWPHKYFPVTVFTCLLELTLRICTLLQKKTPFYATFLCIISKSYTDNYCVGFTISMHKVQLSCICHSLSAFSYAAAPILLSGPSILCPNTLPRSG